MSVLEIEDLTVQYQDFIACQNINMTIEANEIVGLIGQSGSGKSSLAKTILHLNDGAKISYKQLQLNGLDFSQLSSNRQKQFRQNIAWIPQDPTTALCEHLTMQTQLTEQMRYIQKFSKKQALQKAEEMLEIVGISNPKMRWKQYPHQLSGGIKQRMLIAMALCQNPKLIIADELTASLDTVNKANVAKLILHIQKKMGISFLIISHDINFVQAICSTTYVMFASQIVEKRESKDLFQNPKHPYTQDLIEATPTFTKPGKLIVMGSISQKGCKYSSICRLKLPICSESEPDLQTSQEGDVRCFLYDQTRVEYEAPLEATKD